jgi:hypothetical protein
MIDRHLKEGKGGEVEGGEGGKVQGVRSKERAYSVDERVDGDRQGKEKKAKRLEMKETADGAQA